MHELLGMKKNIPREDCTPIFVEYNSQTLPSTAQVTSFHVDQVERQGSRRQNSSESRLTAGLSYQYYNGRNNRDIVKSTQPPSPTHSDPFDEELPNDFKPNCCSLDRKQASYRPRTSLRGKEGTSRREKLARQAATDTRHGYGKVKNVQWQPFPVWAGVRRKDPQLVLALPPTLPGNDKRTSFQTHADYLTFRFNHLQYEPPELTTTPLSKNRSRSTTEHTLQSSDTMPPIVRIQHPLRDQIEAIRQVEEALSGPEIDASFRDEFVAWSQKLVNLNFLTRVHAMAPDPDGGLKITEKDSHRIADWAIEVGTRISERKNMIYNAISTAEDIREEFLAMTARVNFNTATLAECEKSYQTMRVIMQTQCSTPSMYKIVALDRFISLYSISLFDPFKDFKFRFTIVEDAPPYDKVEIPLDVATPLEALMRVLKEMFAYYGDLINLVEIIRHDFFESLEERIPGASDRALSLVTAAGPPNLI
ncbi:hypothetical protein BGW36DRAFT_354170 [Talaromyces proteolyticus]|uniref:Uncharacterized protein n=1 Tax=Talaromyces proteolyticus TaxID=1131652 RepID=A0AAD4Q445_9EURO|nr:uncharacterized protein BGW36DRAFT_354170 [Talaromyces proteolyticus]KAH8705774.1 hypothetical protein BGW36DRAFT_354170 [Talaromyces proteolyticus]